MNKAEENLMKRLRKAAEQKPDASNFEHLVMVGATDEELRILAYRNAKAASQNMEWEGFPAWTDEQIRSYVEDDVAACKQQMAEVRERERQ